MGDRHRPEEIPEYVTPSAYDKFARASRENPAMVIGLGTGASVLTYMAYSWRTSKEKLSVFLIHTRLGVQGSIVGALTVAMGYQLYTMHIKPFVEGHKARKVLENVRDPK